MWAKKAREDFIVSRLGTSEQIGGRRVAVAEGAKSDREATRAEKTGVRQAPCNGKAVHGGKDEGWCPPPFPKRAGWEEGGLLCKLLPMLQNCAFFGYPQYGCNILYNIV